MKKAIKIIIFCMITVILMNLNNIAYASSFGFDITVDETVLQPGDYLNIDMRISDINAGELGINTLEGYLEYDENIFETVTQEDVSGQNNWLITYNSGEGERKGKILAVILSAGETEDVTIGNIKLKVKEGISDTETVIKFTNIATNDGQELIEVADKESKIKIEGEKKEEQKGEEILPPMQIEEENQIVIDGIAPGAIPQTGRGRSIALIVSAAIVIIVAMILRIKYKNIDK